MRTAILSALVVSLAAPLAHAQEPAVAAADAEQRPVAATLTHVPPSEAAGGEPLRLVAVITDGWVEDGLVAHYRHPGASEYRAAPFQRSTAGGYHATIPADAVRRPGVEYYVAGARGDRAHFASAAAPHLVRVEPDPGDRWIEVERRRLAGRVHGVSTRVWSRDFGDTHGADRFVRGELEWTHRLVRSLYSISLGYGFVEGETPTGTMDAAVVAERGARWGYGGVRLRLGDAGWLDGKAILGFGQEGFLAGVGGELILGDDWRTAVMVGGEVMSELSYRAWISLQWDTVPPFLMKATAGTTDQPDSGIDAGSYVDLEIAYPLTRSWTVAGTLSFAARGNRPGGPGAGLAASYDF